MSGAREPLPPILAAHLFSELEGKLIELLRALSPGLRVAFSLKGFHPKGKNTSASHGDEAVGLHILKMISIVG